MRKFFLILVALIFMAPQLVQAQRFRGMEIFGGYSLQRDNLSSTYSPFYLPLRTFGGDISRSGWQVALTENATSWIGMTEQFSGYYGTDQLNGAGNHFSTFSILSGPRFYTNRIKLIVPFAHVLFGYDQTSVKLKGTNLKATSNSYAMAFGGGADLRVTHHLRIRLFQIDYYRPGILGNHQNDLRFSTGVVFRFGGPRY